MSLDLHVLQKKELERKKQHREHIKKELGKFSMLRRGRGGMPLGRYWNAGGDFGATTDPHEMRRQETLEKARMDQMRVSERRWVVDAGSMFGFVGRWLWVQW